MKTINTLTALGWAALLAVLAVITTPLSMAGDGHDHGEAPTAAAGPASPRFTAVSKSFELVGIVDGRQLMLYLDHYTDGSPVKGAELELSFDGVAIPLEPHADGVFEATLAQELKPGEIAVMASIVAGEESDLLTGDLDIHEVEPAASAADSSHSHRWQEYALWAGLGGGGVLLLTLLMARLSASRRLHSGGAA